MDSSERHVSDCELRCGPTACFMRTSVRRAKPLADRRLPIICADVALDVLLDMIRTEFWEMPGLLLTRRQFQRLWELDADTCNDAIDALVKSRFLVRQL